MGNRSKYLIHWTGNNEEGTDIESQPKHERPGLYLARLKEAYDLGLYTKRITEATLRKFKLKDMVRLCFTELHDDDSEEHAARFGKLGIGFSREFIVNKGGRPVIYIPFEAKEEGSLLEDSIKNIHLISEDLLGMCCKVREMQKKLGEIKRYAKYIHTHVKRMSNHGNEDAESYVDFYEEMEWRIVQDERNRRPFKQKNKGKGLFHFEFAPQNVEKIILPDEKTKDKVLADETMIKHFSIHKPCIKLLDKELANNF